jgi:hypothetical protein
MVGFDRHATATDIVADQFLIGSFGGIAFKSLAAGALVCSYIDEPSIRQTFPEPPPIVNCSNAEQLSNTIADLYQNPEKIAAIRHEGRSWIERFHGASRVVDAQAAVYGQVLR